MARGAKARGKRIAFGDGKRIIWGPWSEIIFRGNPNIARPGEERASDIDWIAHHKGHRLYNSLSPDRSRWLWNMDFRPTPGEMFFDATELAFAEAYGAGFVLIEPNVPWAKSVAPNKDWGRARYQTIADRLIAEGRRVIQFAHGRDRLSGAAPVSAPDFRHALAVLSRASLYIGPEGGLHHGAAAVGVPAVVLFGGFIPPQVTGYPTHTNLTGGARACGSLNRCDHCRAAMDAISVDEVMAAAEGRLA
jgi:ADP-heptose:LPS heptosyltransferase